MILDARVASAEVLYKLLAAVIVPRPIALVSTISPDGIPNLAPFSGFMPVATEPPVLAFAPTIDSGRPADTLANIRATGEFVVNLVGASMAAAMNRAAGHYPPEVDEFSVSGLAPAPARHVRPPVVAASPASFECRLVETREYGRGPALTTLITGEVLAVPIPHRSVKALSSTLMSSPEPVLGQLGLNLYGDASDRLSFP